jgi:NitT/TauT family transport system substrate-binding protein
MKSTRRALLAMVGVALVAGACGSSSSGGSGSAKVEKGTFQMGIEPWLGYGGWSVASEKGYYKDNGVDVKITSFTTDDEINAALVAGKLDGANVATHTALRLKAEGTPITIITVLDQSNEADAILAKTGTKIADLKGKKVAFEKGTTSDLLLNAALKANGMSIADVDAQNIPAADVGAALVSGKVDVGVTYEPYITAVLKDNADYGIVYAAKEIPGIISDVFVVRDEVVKSKPGQITALLKSLGKAIEFYGTNATDAQAIIDKSVGADAGSQADAYKGVKFYGTADAKALLAGDYVSKTAPAVLQAAKDAGIITKDVDPKAMIDASFVAKL